MDDKQIVDLFLMGAAEPGDERIVAVSELEDTALRYFVMSSRNSVFDTSDYETIKQIIG